MISNPFFCPSDLRDYSSRRRESRAPENINQHPQPPHQARWGPRQVNGGDIPPPAPLSLRGRAMSENDLRFDGSHRWSPSISVGTSQPLSEVEEGDCSIRGSEAANTGQSNRKKMPPPPRPPPPKWEQFNRRRASHHGLFSSSTFTAPQSTIPSFGSTEGHYPTHTSSCAPLTETSRQRSYSLPPERQEASESCLRCTCSHAKPQEHAFTHPLSNQNQPQIQEHPLTHVPSNQNPAQELPLNIAPPSPLISRRSFNPVAPPQRERELRSTYGEDQERAEILPSPPPPPPVDNNVNR